MLRTKLFKGFAVVALIISVLSAAIGMHTIWGRLLDDAKIRVNLDLESAWSALDVKKSEMETFVKMVASKKLVFDQYRESDWDDADFQGRMELLRANFSLDFFTLTDRNGKVVMRASPPYSKNDVRAAFPAVSRALKGESASGFELLTSVELDRESEGLAEQAFITYENTPHAKASPRTEETRGMVMLASAPINDGPAVVGAVYAGILLNRNSQIADRIKHIVYKDEEYMGRPMGTATIFLGDCRVATTVRTKSGNRAIGTRVSKDVSDRVLDNGLPWTDTAFVVNEWYVSAYEPIKDLSGRIIGMLYVGILKKPFSDLASQLIVRYAWLLFFGLSAALIFAFVLAGRLARPIHNLVEATRIIRQGEIADVAAPEGSSSETTMLVKSFNEMSKALHEREASLTDANERLNATNASYMETLGFVAHELKSPLSSIINYVYLLKEEKIGPLTEKQKKAVASVDINLKRLVEMVRHYLNLSRIENGELTPAPVDINVSKDIVAPILESLAEDIAARGMRVVNGIGSDTALSADFNMTMEVFENLLGNAVKYGGAGGELTLGCAEKDGEFIEFFVRNDGPGIPDDQKENIFGKFTRLENRDLSAHMRGTGLGLFITRNIVNAHGGKITVESSVGEWAEFRFTLPRAGKGK